jgi:DNA-binding NarL/FixJ family response regulator
MSRQLLAEALQRTKQFATASATTREEILELVPSCEVALVSNSSVEDSRRFMELLSEIRRRAPQIRIIAILDSSGPELTVEAFRAGAVGIFSRSDSFQTLCKCIQCVHAGQVWAKSDQLQMVLDAVARPGLRDTCRLEGSHRLSKREEEIAQLVAEGLSNREISRRLRLSEHTIKNYLFRAFEKLGVGTRVELALFALSNGELQGQRRKTGTG